MYELLFDYELVLSFKVMFILCVADILVDIIFLCPPTRAANNRCGLQIIVNCRGSETRLEPPVQCGESDHNTDFYLSGINKRGTETDVMRNSSNK